MFLPIVFIIIVVIAGYHNQTLSMLDSLESLDSSIHVGKNGKQFHSNCSWMASAFQAGGVIPISVMCQLFQ